MRRLLRLSSFLAFSLLWFACGGGGSQVDESEALFQPDHILEVSITMDPADFAVLREQPDVIGAHRVTCGAQPVERDYTYFHADVTVDGVTVTDVGVRKKGGFGSISSLRPGLKIKAHEYVPGQRIFGLHRLTLNNNVQDPSYISQCLGYGLFRQAGVPAARCSFAHVTVNGEDLGLYSNVETLKQNFLSRHFADDSGRLYESGGDFVPGGLMGFQPKTNRMMPDCSDLSPVADALTAPPETLSAELGRVVDLDEFTTFWAMEVLTDHWDGYANNQNNFYFYHDPTSDRMHFIPWGIDALFTGRERTTRPDSVFACGSIPWHLYHAPDSRRRYLDRLRTLLDEVWDEAAILAEIDRLEALVLPVADPDGSAGVADAIERTRAFVRGRRATLLAELDAGEPEWPFAQGEESCRVKVGEIGGTFDTTFDTLDDFMAGTGHLMGTVNGTAIDADGGANAGTSPEAQPVVQVFTPLPDGRIGFVVLIAEDPAAFAPGTHDLDLVNYAAIMTFYDPATDSSSGGGLVLGGSVTLDSAEATPGGRVAGSFTMGSVLEL